MRHMFCLRSSVTARRNRKATLAVKYGKGVGDDDGDDDAAAVVEEEEEVVDPRFVPGTRIKWEWISEIEDI